MLRDPSVRLWIAFHSYGQYSGRYGSGVAGFLKYFAHQSEVVDACSTAHGAARCALRFEALGPAEADLFFHADQLLKGMYAVFLPEWQRYLRRGLHVVRTEDYFQNPLRALRRVVRHLNLPQLAPDAQRAAEGERNGDEARAVAASHGMPSPSELEPVRRFYAPFNQDLARLLGDKAFLWQPAAAAPATARGAAGGMATRLV
eukprot:3832226-Prymnesium_polylepis.1